MAGDNRRSVPSWDELNNNPGVAGEAFEEAVLNGDASYYGGSFGPRKRTFRRKNKALRPDPLRYLDDARNPILRNEIRHANLYDADVDLLPYQPTPTSEPGRPRTLAAGYDRTSRQLRVKFRNGSRYVYYDVPPDVWDGFQAASSPGRFMNEEIVDVFEYEQETAPYLPDPWPRGRRR